MKRRVALIAAIVLSVQFVLGAAVPASATLSSNAPVKAAVPSIVHKDVSGDLLNGAGSFDSETNTRTYFANTSEAIKWDWVNDKNGGFLEGYGALPKEYSAYRFEPGVEIPAGIYKITFSVRTSYEGHKSVIYPQAYDTDGKLYFLATVGITDEWFEVVSYVKFDAPISHINFRGGMLPEACMPYCIDELSIVSVSAIPSGWTSNQGANVSDAEVKASYESLQYIDPYPELPKWEPDEDYAVDGLMVNLDNTMHGIAYATSEDVAINWANQFRGTHVTDMVMNFAESKCVYPTEVFFGWYGDPQTQMVDGVISSVEGTGGSNNPYYRHYKDLGLDYLKTLTTALPEIGINMWLSIRMNDAHDRNSQPITSSLFTEYYFANPQYRRIQYDSKVNVYYAKIWDYTFPDIRQKYLALVNEALDRYDVYGFQFEWQREMWLFHPGGEYAGIEIMNQFYRDAAAIIDIYEEKYGHKIMFSSTVAPDLQTNYDFGLDIMTWASEGIIDMLVPMGRYATTCNETPVALWKSLLEPYGIEVAPCIEAGISTGVVGRQNLSIENFAGAAALYLSQGADRIQLHNVVPDLSYRASEDQKLAIYDQSTLSKYGFSNWWSIFTSCGSYEKLMTLPRKVIPTYNDVQQTWKSTYTSRQLPITVRAGKTGVIRVGMGDIPEGAKVTLKFTASNIVDGYAPTVYINSVRASFIRTQDVSELNSYDSAFSTTTRYLYEVPAAVYDDMWAVVEITPTNSAGFTVDYAEIYIEPAK